MGELANVAKGVTMGSMVSAGISVVSLEILLVN